MNSLCMPLPWWWILWLFFVQLNWEFMLLYWYHLSQHHTRESMVHVWELRKTCEIFGLNKVRKCSYINDVVWSEKTLFLVVLCSFFFVLSCFTVNIPFRIIMQGAFSIFYSYLVSTKNETSLCRLCDDNVQTFAFYMRRNAKMARG